jgi:YD repeat-containing protein
VGNRLSQTSTAGPGNNATYSYDANNRLTVAFTNVGHTAYTYDANGNLTGTSDGASFAWDVFNRMTSAAGGMATYTYNGNGLKIRRIGPDGTTRYYYDGIRPIWEADGAGSMTAQLDRDIFGNLLSRKEPVGTRRYYHFDGLGSTTALSDEGGATVATLLTMPGATSARRPDPQCPIIVSRGPSSIRRAACTTWGRGSTIRQLRGG